MYKVRTAKREFTATCGHGIDPGDKFLVEEPRPVFHCKKCGIEEVGSAYKEWLQDLEANEEEPAEEGER